MTKQNQHNKSSQSTTRNEEEELDERDKPVDSEKHSYRARKTMMKASLGERRWAEEGETLGERR
jgi:hypothetical protein